MTSSRWTLARVRPDLAVHLSGQAEGWISLLPGAVKGTRFSALRGGGGCSGGGVSTPAPLPPARPPGGPRTNSVVRKRLRSPGCSRTSSTGGWRPRSSSSIGIEGGSVCLAQAHVEVRVAGDAAEGRLCEGVGWGGGAGPGSGPEPPRAGGLKGAGTQTSAAHRQRLLSRCAPALALLALLAPPPLRRFSSPDVASARQVRWSRRRPALPLRLIIILVACDRPRLPGTSRTSGAPTRMNSRSHSLR